MANEVERHDLSPAELLAAQQGDMRAFEAIVFRYERQLFAYIFRFVHHYQDTEDLLQETFLKIYRALHSYQLEKKFSTWIYTIATNTVYDWLRKKRRRPEALILDDPDNPFETPSPKNAYQDIDTKHDLEHAIARLKPVYQTVLSLFYREDLRYEEISQMLKLPINTVKTYLHRARAALKDVYIHAK